MTMECGAAVREFDGMLPMRKRNVNESSADDGIFYNGRQRKAALDA